MGTVNDTSMDMEMALSVVETVAEADGKDPIDLPPLYDTIDPESLDDLLEGAGDPTITFTYNGHEVKVEKDAVRVADLTPDP